MDYFLFFFCLYLYPPYVHLQSQRGRGRCNLVGIKVFDVKLSYCSWRFQFLDFRLGPYSPHNCNKWKWRVYYLCQCLYVKCCLAQVCTRNNLFAIWFPKVNLLHYGLFIVYASLIYFLNALTGSSWLNKVIVKKGKHHHRQNLPRKQQIWKINPQTSHMCYYCSVYLGTHLLTYLRGRIQCNNIKDTSLSIRQTNGILNRAVYSKMFLCKQISNILWLLCFISVLISLCFLERQASNLK